jgi:hypothetical protein
LLLVFLVFGLFWASYSFTPSAARQDKALGWWEVKADVQADVDSEDLEGIPHVDEAMLDWE